MRHQCHPPGRRTTKFAGWLVAAALALPGFHAARSAAAPSPDAPTPATRPAGPSPAADVAAAAAPAPAEPKVLVLPFQVVGGRGGDAWVGRSVQQNLLTDLIADGPFPASAGTATPADPGAAAGAAAAARARYVVYGVVHLNDRPDSTAVRVTGQVLDAAGRPRGTFKATGMLDDLFALEDELADQVRRQLDRLAADDPAAARAALPRLPSRRAPPAASVPDPVIEYTGPVRGGDYRPDPDWADARRDVVPPPAAYRYRFGTPYGYGGYARPYFYGGPGYGYGRGFGYGPFAPIYGPSSYFHAPRSFRLRVSLPAPAAGGASPAVTRGGWTTPAGAR